MILKCWICRQPITEALSLPTIDPNKRVCLHCDSDVICQKVTAMPRGIFAVLAADLGEKAGRQNK